MAEKPWVGWVAVRAARDRDWARVPHITPEQKARVEEMKAQWRFWDVLVDQLTDSVGGLDG